MNITSNFRNQFLHLAATVPVKTGKKQILKASFIETPLGPMIAIANDNALFLLEFTDRRRLEREIAKLKKATKADIIVNRNGGCGGYSGGCTRKRWLLDLERRIYCS
jgi:AraC family transcriptional regulator, regulatory protein of adaptative response / methylated-DNA-[protein]-cysteine methyltransferase